MNNLFYIELKISLEKIDEILAGWRKFFTTKVFPDEIFLDKAVTFPNLFWNRQKYALLSVSMQRSLSVFLKNIFADIVGLAFISQITFSRSFENNWNNNVSFKIILIGEKLFLQMYPNEMGFLINWFLRIKWLFVISVKIITIQKKIKNKIN